MNLSKIRNCGLGNEIIWLLNLIIFKKNYTRLFALPCSWCCLGANSFLPQTSRKHAYEKIAFQAQGIKHAYLPHEIYIWVLSLLLWKSSVLLSPNNTRHSSWWFHFPNTEYNSSFTFVLNESLHFLPFLWFHYHGLPGLSPEATVDLLPCLCHHS